jgi:hypothetical protein
MEIFALTKYGHRILRIIDKIGVKSDISPLRRAIGQVFKDGYLHVAISIPEGSFLPSRLLALLIESAEKATERGGTFTVIAPNSQVNEVLSMFDLEWTLRTANQERELLQMPVRLET